MTDLTPSGYIGIDEALAAFCERIYRGVPESDHARELQEGGLSIGSADRHADAVEALRRAVVRGSLEVFAWHSGMSITVKLSATTLARLRMLGQRTYFLRTGHVRVIELARAGVSGELAKGFSALRCFFEESAFRIWLDRRERRLRSSHNGDLARPIGRGRPSKAEIIEPMIKDIVEGGLWDRSWLPARMADLLNRQLKSDYVCADTVAKVMDDLYAETQEACYERRRKRPKAPVGSRTAGTQMDADFQKF